MGNTNMKYTIIYKEMRQSCARHYSVTQMKRIEVNSESNFLTEVYDQIGTENILFIFEGWPKLEGEA